MTRTFIFICLFTLSIATKSEESAATDVVAEDEEAKAEDVQVEVNGETKNGSDVFLFPVSMQTLYF